jgi:ATP-dependent protease ClpP protease subunit
MGAKLTSLLNNAVDKIDESESDDRSRADVISQLARAAGISEGTVNQIINGSIDCPPENRLRGFARVDGMPSFASMRSAGNADGCSYGEKGMDDTLTPKKNEKRATFLNRANNADWAPHVWRLANDFRFDAMEMPEGVQTILPLCMENEGDMLRLFFTRDIQDIDEAADVVEVLRNNPDIPVDMEINSRGGSADLATGMFNALMDHAGEVTARITGQAASAAMFLSQAADRILINENARMMVHPGSVLVVQSQEFGKAQEAHDLVDFVDELIQKGTEQIIDMLAKRSGMTRGKVENLVTAKGGLGTTLSAKEAVKMGFADEIIETTARKSLDASTKAAVFNSWRERELAEAKSIELELQT